MAISKSDIINKALTLVGAGTVISIDDDSENARVLNRTYEIALKSILSECKWNFATKRSTLSEVTNTLDWTYNTESNVYQKPSDLIRIFDTNPQRAIFREEGDYIIADSSSFGIQYVYYHDVPSKYPGYFLDAFIDKLAGDIAYAIVNSASLAEKMLTKYENISLPKATSANSQTGTQQTPIDDAWELAKYNDFNPLA